MARQELVQGRPGVDPDPQHPSHAETSATAMEMSLRELAARKVINEPGEGHVNDPRSGRWQLLDYVLVQRRDRQDVLVTKAIRDAGRKTDHCLVLSKKRLQMQPRRRPHGQKSSTEITSAPDQHRRRPGPSNLATLSTQFLRANRTGRTSSDPMHHQSDNSNFYVKFCQPSFGLPHPRIISNTPTIIETKSQCSSLVPPTTATTTAFAFTTTTTTIDGDSLLNCPQCDCIFTSRTGLIGHLRIYRMEAGEPVPGALTYSQRTRLHCPHCSRTFTYRMDPLGHMHIQDNLR
ncbi:unnamed protein product [Schistocephalus solidus]|uniref:C2H2-type domain-containing protein n=1 Tax=Schistocephalus solidus TaxID=70667 RepID=A0A183TM74_SCHSO|nr:unnamed protein product [Schistocephalus solidus]